jgi:hypothetical protein
MSFHIVKHAPFRARPWFRKRSISIGAVTGAVIVLIVLCVQTLRRSSSEWQAVYVEAGRQFLAGRDFYTSGIGYAYPPFMALVAAPLASVPEWVSRLAWFASSAASMVVMIAFAWRLANGMPLNRMGLGVRGELCAFAAGLAISLGFIFNAFAHQQTDVLTGGLMMAGALLLSNGNLAGGAFIGVAAACKATPLLWAPYLLWRHHQLAGALVVIVAVAANLVPDMIVPSPSGDWWIQGWVDNFIRPTLRLDAPLGLWASAIEYNQSLSGTIERLVNTKLLFSPKPTILVRDLVDPITLKGIVYTIFALLLAASIFVAARAQRQMPSGATLPARESYEFSMVMILMLLLSPMSGRAHFGTLVLPAFCLARFACLTGNRVILALLAFVVLLVAPPYGYLAPEGIHSAVLWGGATTVAAMLLWIGCVIVLWRNFAKSPNEAARMQEQAPG